MSSGQDSNLGSLTLELKLFTIYQSLTILNQYVRSLKKYWDFKKIDQAIF